MDHAWTSLLFRRWKDGAGAATSGPYNALSFMRACKGQYEHDTHGVRSVFVGLLTHRPRSAGIRWQEALLPSQVSGERPRSGNGMSSGLGCMCQPLLP